MHTIETLCMICFLAGGVGAVLQGMLGIGTGIIIVPVLTFILPVYDIPQNQAIHVAIAVNAITALISHYRYNNIDWSLFRKIFWFSTLGAGMGAFGATFLAGSLLQKIFGFFLFFVAFCMLLQKSAFTIQAQVTKYFRLKIILGGFGVGCIASLIGSGGGILMVPFLRTLH